MNRWEYTECELWRHSKGEVSIMHLFGTVAIGNTVLIFAEARHGKGGDANCAHDIYMKKSVDGGKSFLDNRNLLDSFGKICYVNPVPVYDKNIDRLFLFYAINKVNTATENYYIFSDNKGDSWSDPVDITVSLQNGGMPFNLPGPGHGIQLKNGRLLIPFWHRKFGPETELEKRGYCLSMLYSDDHGANWSQNGFFGEACLANESRIAETSDSLIWNARTFSQNRFEAKSLDGGLSWSEFTVSPLPPAVPCDASIVGLNAENSYENTVLFSHVSSTEERKDMEICISLNGGKSYDNSFKLMTGDAIPGYSDLSVIDETTVGLVHARNNHVLFSRISMEALTGGDFDKVSRNPWP